MEVVIRNRRLYIDGRTVEACFHKPKLRPAYVCSLTETKTNNAFLYMKNVIAIRVCVKILQ